MIVMQPSHTNVVLVGRFSLAQTDSLLMRMRSVASDELHQMMQRRMSQENPIRASETEFVQRLQKLVVLAVNRLIYHGAVLLLLLLLRLCMLSRSLTVVASLLSDVSQDFFDLLNIPDSPDQQVFSAEPHESGSIPHSPGPFNLPPASKKSFQKDILKLMTDGIKTSLVRRRPLGGRVSVCWHHEGLISVVLTPQGSTGRGGAPHHQWRRILWSCRDTFRVQIGRLLVHTLSPALPLSDRKEALEFVFDARHLDILKESLSPSLEVMPAPTLVLYGLFLCVFRG